MKGYHLTMYLVLLFSLMQQLEAAAHGQAASESLPLTLAGQPGTLTVSFTPDVPSDGSTPSTA